MPSLPARPPFRLRARLITPLAVGGIRYLDDCLVEVDQAGRIARVSAGPDDGPTAGAAPGAAGSLPPLYDLRPWVLLPGMVDLHTHVPQLPNAGVGAGLDLLAWLDRYTYPLESGFDAAAAAGLAPRAFAAMAAAGTTTVVAYATDDAAATEEVFRAAEQHGIRAVIGLVLMQREPLPDRNRLGPGEEAALQASADLRSRWDGRDDGRLRYAVTPRFAVSCSSVLLREASRLAERTGAYWQTHLAEDAREREQVDGAFPGARDYLDVYERAGALRTKAIFAHAIHLSVSEVGRLAQSGAAIAHCPASNLFLASGIMPLARYLDAGLRVGLGSDVSGGPSLSLFEVMRVGSYAQRALQVMRPEACPALDPSGWLTLGTLAGARALGIDGAVGSIEVGKEADVIAVDPAATDPLPGIPIDRDPEAIVSRLIFRTHPAMVRAAWVRGRLLPAESEGPR